ncbi:hypothetical protein B566_EDAN008752, partial [Ephemera danica]
MQGFCGNNNCFFPKEVTILQCISFEIEKEYNAILKSPYLFEDLNIKYKRTATWLSKNYHNLYWNEGDHEIKEFINHLHQLTSTNQKVFVKGANKAKYISNILKCPNLEIIDRKSGTKISKNCYTTLPVYCKKHSMNTKQLKAFLQAKNRVGKEKHKVGVYSADKLPKSFSKPAAFIANTDESHLPGDAMEFFVAFATALKESLPEDLEIENPHLGGISIQYHQRLPKATINPPMFTTYNIDTDLQRFAGAAAGCFVTLLFHVARASVTDVHVAYNMKSTHPKNPIVIFKKNTMLLILHRVPELHRGVSSTDLVCGGQFPYGSQYYGSPQSLVYSSSSINAAAAKHRESIRVTVNRQGGITTTSTVCSPQGLLLSIHSGTDAAMH